MAQDKCGGGKVSRAVKFFGFIQPNHVSEYNDRISCAVEAHAGITVVGTIIKISIYDVRDWVHAEPYYPLVRILTIFSWQNLGIMG